MKRVEKRPLLVQRERMEFEKARAQRKALYLVKKSLEKAGITDIQQFFSEQELNQLNVSKNNKL